jgi:VanZ family protein
LLAAGLGFMVFVVYGSLVPFNFRPQPFDVAWETFQKTPWLVLGIVSRADWVANLLLYIPLGFLFTGALSGTRTHPEGNTLATAIGVFMLGALLAIGIEFTQIFFPPRTRSLNDIAAELLGTAAGIGLWWAAGKRVSRLLGTVTFGGALALRAAVTVYVLGYLSLALFPFDFLLNAAELQGKISSGTYSLFLVSGACGGFLRCSVKVAAEVAAVAPLGFLMGMTLGCQTARPYAKALIFGCLLGVVIEVAQFFIASGVSQGVSILTRGFGVMLGVFLQRAVSPGWFEAARSYFRPAVLIGAAPYLLLLLALHGWFASDWTGLGAAFTKLAEVRFVPLYYHYWTTESAALQSLLRVAAAYMPLGIGYWMWCTGATRDGKGKAWIPVTLAAAIAFVVETGRLFVPEKRPDPTDVLIAAFAAYAGYALAIAIRRWAAQGLHAGSAGLLARPRVRAAIAADEPRLATGVWSLFILMAASALLLLHPFSLLTAALLAAYAAFIWRWPESALPAVLALLPLLNFSPWTGWILLNEFDLLVGVTVAVWLLRRPTQPHLEVRRNLALWVVGPLAVSVLISALIGLFPFQTFDQGLMTSYYGSFNSLRVAKGFVWALLLVPLVGISSQHPGRTKDQFVTGMVLGLCGVVAVTVWQRIAIVGLLDFTTDFRMTATFPETHIGGGDAEAYFVMALPFALAWIALRPTATRIALGMALFTMGSYALAVTYARAGYLAYPVVLLILGIAVVLQLLQQRGRRFPRLAMVAGVVLVATVVVIPVMGASYMKARFETVQRDTVIRVSHWTQAIGMMDPGARTAIFGMGLGSFPRTHFLSNPDGAIPATFNYLRERENRFVRLGSGVALYLDQRVTAAAGELYTLSLDLRSADPKAELSVSLCEKTEQHSFYCKATGFQVPTSGEKWVRVTRAFNSGKVGASPWFFRPPVVLTLHSPREGTRIDVDNISLLDPEGHELVTNGNFSRGGDRWFFTTDNHSQWHIFNLWVHAFFEQGWLGVLALAAIIGAALVRLGVRMWQGDIFSATLLASLCGALIVGLFNSLLDGPRVTSLLFLLLFTALVLPRAQSRRREDTDQSGNASTDMNAHSRATPDA